MSLSLGRRAYLLLFFVMLLFGCTASRQEARSPQSLPDPLPRVPIQIKPGVVSGKATFKDQPLAGVYVYLYREFPAKQSSEPGYTSEETGADGSFRLKVNPGSYYLLARKGEEYFCYYGANPLNVLAGRELEVGLNLAAERTVNGQELMAGMTQGSGIRGLVYHEDQPLAGAQVMIYLNANSNFKGMGYDQRYTDQKGRFLFDLPEGTYYLLVRKRKSGQMAGPLVTGDYYAYFSGNPVEVVEGKYLDLAMSSVIKQDRLKADQSGRTMISGQVQNEKQEPVAGVYVGAYLSNKVMGKPDFVSKLTSEDGRFELELPRGGRYYLMARNTYAGPPLSGDLSGWYQGSDDHGITVKDGEQISMIEITVTTMW